MALLMIFVPGAGVFAVVSNDVSLPLIVIAGPTASGKTGLAIQLAARYGGEIISADSRAIYKGMDIGAAKPTVQERLGVPHWGFDLTEPGERFTAADFKVYANTKIQEIRLRGHIPILVGGTGLYIDAVLFDFDFPPETLPADKERWAALSLAELHEYCVKNNVKLPENTGNRRYIINAIVRNGHIPRRKSLPRADAIVVAIATERDVLRSRIEARARQIIKAGVVGETERLVAQYGWESEAMKGNIYPLVARYIRRQISLDELVTLATTKDWRLAKRQITWLKRNEHINWLTLKQAHTYLTHILDLLNKS